MTNQRVFLKKGLWGEKRTRKFGLERGCDGNGLKGKMEMALKESNKTEER